MTNRKRLILLIALTFAATQNLLAQNIYTVAGNGTAGFTGAGGAALSAGINPDAVGFDAAGNMYILQEGGYWSTDGVSRLLKIDATTNIISCIGGQGTNFPGDGGPATSATWGNYNPDIIFDNSGNLYFADFGDGLIRKIDMSSGIINTVAGLGTTGTALGDGGPATAATLMQPVGIAFDPSGNLYIADAGSYRIRKVDASTGIITTIAGNGIYGSTGDGGPASAAELIDPEGLRIDAVGNIYFVEWPAKIRKIDASTGIITTLAGNGTTGDSGDGGPATAATIETNYLAIDCNNNIYIEGKYRLRKIDASSGIITSIAGTGTFGYSGDGGPATAANIFPHGNMAFDNAGNLYYGDNNQLSGRVRMICMNNLSSISIAASPGTSVCYGVPVTFTVSSSISGCNAVNWYKVGSSTVVGTGLSYTDPSPADGEQVYCVASGGNAINGACGSSSSVTSNIITITADNFQLTDVDINTHCLPGYSSPSVTPTFSTTVTGGTGPYTYSWYTLLPTSGVIGLNDYTIANPQVIFTGSIVAPSMPAEWYLTVTDANGCGASRYIPVDFTTRSTYDLASRDSHYDMYDEPNSQRSYNGGPYDIFSGPDIWNRLTPDGFMNTTNQAPQYSGGANNYLYVKVRNVGCTTSPGDVSLNTYWTIGGIGGSEGWRAYWDGSTSVSGLPTGNTLPSSPISLPNILPGHDSIFPFTWVPPNPTSYPVFVTYSVTGSYQNMDLCFLSYISDIHNPADVPWGLTIDPTPLTSASLWCMENNNMATLNTGVIWMHNRPSPHLLTVGNSTGLHSVSIQASNYFTLHPGTGTSTLSNFAYFKIYLGDVFNAWQAAGGFGTYIAMDASEHSVTFDGSHTMQLDSIPLPDTGQYYLTIVSYPVEGANLALMQPEKIVLRELDSRTGQAAGGYTYTVIDSGESEGGRQSHAAPIPAKTTDAIKVYPNPASATLNFEFPPAKGSITIKLLDVTGRLMDEQVLNNTTQTSFSVRGYNPGVYIYQVISNDKINSGKFLVE